MNSITLKLNALQSLYSNAEDMEKEKKSIIEKLIPSEYLFAMKEVEEEFSMKNAAISSKIKELEEEVKKNVIEEGKTISTDGITVVYNKGRINWDSTILSAYLAEHPNSFIKIARKEGSPYASIKKKD